MFKNAVFVLSPIFLVACSGGTTRPDMGGSGAFDFTMPLVDAPPTYDLTQTGMCARPAGHFCDLPGSVKWQGGAATTVPGGSGADPKFMKLPDGFCAHYFGNVGDTRQIRFSPSCEAFVASPTNGTTGGNAGAGKAAIMVLPDDNLDGVADSVITFLGQLPSTQGMLFAPGYFYYQDLTKIMRMPYSAGDRVASGRGDVVADITVYTSGLHWPKAIDMADDGTIYVANGGDQGDSCDSAHPFHGGILQIDPAPGGAHPGGIPIVKGLRNPIAVQCARGHDRCFALELAKDYSAMQGGREKLIPIHVGDDWGYPCCATQNLPYMDVTNPNPNCGGVTPETVSFVIGDTPFGVDFEPGKWPAPFTGSAFASLHGVFGSWSGARVVAIEMDATSGLPKPGTDLNGKPSGAMTDFITGWDDGTQSHGRPATASFSPDGRLFVGNDVTGDIFWIAPVGL